MMECFTIFQLIVSVFTAHNFAALIHFQGPHQCRISATAGSCFLRKSSDKLSVPCLPRINQKTDKVIN